MNLKVELTGLVDEVDMGCERKGGRKEHSKHSVLAPIYWAYTVCQAWQLSLKQGAETVCLFPSCFGAFCPLRCINNAFKCMLHAYTPMHEELKLHREMRQKGQKDWIKAIEIEDGTKREAQTAGLEQEGRQQTQAGDSDSQVEKEKDDRAVGAWPRQVSPSVSETHFPFAALTRPIHCVWLLSHIKSPTRAAVPVCFAFFNSVLPRN